MEEDTATYPLIEPSKFDLIVVGTGLPESIIAAAASTAGKSVIQLDPQPFYGGPFASLSLHDLTSLLQTLPQSPSPSPRSEDGDGDFSLIPLLARPLFSSVEIRSYSPELLELSRKFSLDLAGPRVLFCADSMIDLILKSEVNHYLEFKGVDASFISDGEGNLSGVPDSRASIFKDRSLGLTEKNQLMKFFKMVQGHLEVERDEESGRILEEDLDSPFVEFLGRMGLSSKLKSIILYAILMADYDQDTMEGCKDIVKTRDGINRLALYHSSIGRFPNAPSAMIYPIYGQGELPQSFCRRAAVKGCICALRMPVVGLLVDKNSGSYKGVKLVSGQDLFSEHLILAPSFVFPSPLASNYLQDTSRDTGLRDGKKKVARGICITKSSLRKDVANCLVFFPPRSLYSEQATSIRTLQLSSNVAVCPPGMFVACISSACEDDEQGKRLVQAAINALFSSPVPDSSENIVTEHQSADPEVKPALLWSALYIQETISGACDIISYIPTPDGCLHYNDLMDATAKIFQKMYPSEEFFPKSENSEDTLDSAGPFDLES